MDLNTTLGVIGMALILLAFILSQMGEWEDTELRYDLTNLIGSGLMVYYAYTLDSVPSRLTITRPDSSSSVKASKLDM